MKWSKIKWSKKLAYAIGLIATDGSLSKDERHIILVSKDFDQLTTFAEILNLANKISLHISSYNPTGKYYHIQFGNVELYRFLVNIGLTPNKSLILSRLKIPPKYFADFLRGHLDGDGNISAVRHPESQFPQLRLRFCSASIKHLQWIKYSILQIYNISGGFISKPMKSARYLVYSKASSIALLEFMYQGRVKYFLKRKYQYYIDKMPR